MVNDILILRQLDHPNIIKVFDCYQFKNNFYVTTEYIGGGELYDRLEKKETLCEKECANVIS